MSNSALDRLLRGGGLTSFHVADGSASRREDPHVMFRGERHHATFSMSENTKHDYSKKENREESNPKKKQKKYGDDSDSDSGSDSDSDSGGPNFSKKGIHAKGSDAGTICKSHYALTHWF